MAHSNDPSMGTSDSAAYQQKKRVLNRLLTIYGRKPVLEALATPELSIHRLHLADSNKSAKILDDIIALAEQRQIDIAYHAKSALSRISKNAKQDQGIALDIAPKGFEDFADFKQSLASAPLATRLELIAVDNVTNPQNLGMIIRSVCASPMRGLLLPNRGCAKLDSLVIKASAGTLFKAKIIRCDNLGEALYELASVGFTCASLQLDGATSIYAIEREQRRVFVLGNETDGVSADIQKHCTEKLKIPMHNGVESLNVAVTAAILAFLP